MENLRSNIFINHLTPKSDYHVTSPIISTHFPANGQSDDQILGVYIKKKTNKNGHISLYLHIELEHQTTVKSMLSVLDLSFVLLMQHLFSKMM